MIQVRIYRAVNGRSTNRVFWRQGAFRELPRIGESVTLNKFGKIKVVDIEHNPDCNSLDVILKSDIRGQTAHPNLNIDDSLFEQYMERGWHLEEA